MRNLNNYYDELVDLIYQIPLSADGWQPFVKRMNTILGSSLIHILGIDLEKDVYSFSNCSGLLPDEELMIGEIQYLRYPISDDPRMAGFFSPERKGWYQCHHDITQDIVDNSTLYQNILLPRNMRYTAVQEFLRDEKICVLMGINTSNERGILQQEELDFLDRLFVHLRRVVLLQRKLYEFSANSIVGFELVNKLSQPIMLLNLSGKVVHYNVAVKNICDNNSILKIENKNLILPEPYNIQLDESLSYFESYFKQQQLLGQSKFEDSCLKIESENGDSLYIFSTLLVSENEMKMFGIRPMVMLTFYDPAHSTSMDVPFLCATFRFTPAEAKVALMLLDGHIPKEISKINNVHIDTVRKQLRSIYQKTGTNRQSALVRLLLNIPKFIEA